MHAGIAVDGDPPACHAPANPSDLPQIAAHIDLVALLAVHREEIVDATLSLAEEHRQGTDRGVVERADRIGTNTLRLERHTIDRLFQHQRDHRVTHGTVSGCFSRVISVG